VTKPLVPFRDDDDGWAYKAVEEKNEILTAP
jgi:hypothetical protein